MLSLFLVSSLRSHFKVLTQIPLALPRTKTLKSTELITRSMQSGKNVPKSGGSQMSYIGKGLEHRTDAGVLVIGQVKWRLGIAAVYQTEEWICARKWGEEGRYGHYGIYTAALSLQTTEKKGLWRGPRGGCHSGYSGQAEDNLESCQIDFIQRSE